MQTATSYNDNCYATSISTMLYNNSKADPNSEWDYNSPSNIYSQTTLYFLFIANAKSCEHWQNQVEYLCKENIFNQNSQSKF